MTKLPFDHETGNVTEYLKRAESIQNEKLKEAKLKCRNQRLQTFKETLYNSLITIGTVLLIILCLAIVIGILAYSYWLLFGEPKVIEREVEKIVIEEVIVEPPITLSDGTVVTHDGVVTLPNGEKVVDVAKYLDRTTENIALYSVLTNVP